MHEAGHRITVSRTHRFLLPTCTCGWVGTARVADSAARQEARDHALLYAGRDVSADEIRALAALDPGDYDPSA